MRSSSSPAVEVSMSSMSTASRKGPGQVLGGETMIAANWSSCSGVKRASVRIDAASLEEAIELQHKLEQCLGLDLAEEVGVAEAFDFGLCHDAGGWCLLEKGRLP